MVESYYCTSYCYIGHVFSGGQTQKLGGAGVEQSICT